MDAAWASVFNQIPTIVGRVLSDFTTPFAWVVAMGLVTFIVGIVLRLSGR